MQKPIRKRRVEDDGKPVDRLESAIDNFVTLGGCIQELVERIQNEESSVPNATIRAAKKCVQVGTNRRPNSRTPKKVDSKKNAIKPS